MMIRLYDFELSGNCYKARLLMGILNVPFERVAVDFYPGREHKSAWFLGINPLGQLPVIDDDGFVLRDSNAILVYVASKYDASGKWFPRGAPQVTAKIAEWLAFADGLTATASAKGAQPRERCGIRREHGGVYPQGSRDPRAHC